jgi:hypothetical protein
VVNERSRIESDERRMHSAARLRPAREHRTALSLLTLLLAATVTAAPTTASGGESRRLFDFAPVSSENPVVATIDGKIQIPLSELRAYQKAERLTTISPAADLGLKRRVLNELIDEYLLVDEAYRSGVATSPAFTKQMEATRTLILTDFMATRALKEAKAGTPMLTHTALRQDHAAPDAAAAVADRLFESASIDISNEAFAILKRAANAIDATAASSRRGPVVDSPEDAATKIQGIIQSAPDAVIVRYADKTMRIRTLLALYSGAPSPRPAIQSESGFVAFIKPLIEPELMALEAVKQGIEGDPLFQEKYIQNQNTLLRFHMQGAIEHQAGLIMRQSDGEAQVRAWYEQHRADYAVALKDGRTRPATFEEARPRAEGDYSVALLERVKAEKVAALRKQHAIAIDEAALGRL